MLFSSQLFVWKSRFIRILDIASVKVPKTHIEFERNIKNKKIEIYNLN
jgi:hypothetical protein